MQVERYAFLFAVASCGGTTGTAGNDSGIPRDSSVSSDAHRTTDGLARDAGQADGVEPIDASDVDASLGSPCGNGTDCPVLCEYDAQCTKLCLNQSPFRGGYCSVSIAECPAPSGSDSGSGPCPGGSFCVTGLPPTHGSGDYCLLGCTTDSQCRTSDGYKCCKGFALSGASVCAPASLCR
jgi:hypothetical protein